MDTLNYTYKCEHCGRETSNVEVIGNGDELCSNCISDYTDPCYHCGERFPLEDMIEYGSFRFLCSSCYRSNYFTCRFCGEVMGDFYYNGIGDCCDNCCEIPEEETLERYLNGIEVYNHGYKPRPIFFKCVTETNPLFMGVELEVEQENYQRCDAFDNADKFYYLKEDGSLSDDGVEIVTHPASFRYHTEVFRWKDFLQRLVKGGYVSHDNTNCGLHIHLSRSSFTDDSIEVLMFTFEHFWSLFTKFSRRTASQLCDWCSRITYSNDSVEERKRKVKCHCDDAKYNKENIGRYRAVNLNPENTIEIRIFRGTLKYSSFLACLELCQFLHEFSTSFSLEEVERLDEKSFLDMLCQVSENMKKYLKERRFF